jgi:hypothetical protein
VEVDPEVQPFLWSKAADFDLAVLHDWPEREAAMREFAQVGFGEV